MYGLCPDYFMFALCYAVFLLPFDYKYGKAGAITGLAFLYFAHSYLKIHVVNKF